MYTGYWFVFISNVSVDIIISHLINSLLYSWVYDLGQGQLIIMLLSDHVVNVKTPQPTKNGALHNSEKSRVVLSINAINKMCKILPR